MGIMDSSEGNGGQILTGPGFWGIKLRGFRFTLTGRVKSGLVLYPLSLILIWLGGPILLLCITLMALLASHEFYGLMRRMEYQPNELGGLLLTLVFALFSASAITLPLLLPMLIVLLIIFWTNHLFTLPQAEDIQRRRNLIYTICGAMYTGGLLAYAYAIRQLPNGFAWLLAIMFGITNCDNAGLWVGRLLGRHKIAPVVSPNKTWEGFIAGLPGAFLSVWGVATYFQLTTMLHILGLSLVIWILDIIGDLTESKLKRRVGVKDSGRLLPGMGGVLDRIDSWVTTLPAAYLYLLWLVSS